MYYLTVLGSEVQRGSHRAKTKLLAELWSPVEAPGDRLLRCLCPLLEAACCLWLVARSPVRAAASLSFRSSLSPAGTLVRTLGALDNSGSSVLGSLVVSHWPGPLAVSGGTSTRSRNQETVIFKGPLPGI